MDWPKLLERSYEQRKSWVDLPGGKRLQYSRPEECEIPKFLSDMRSGVFLEHITKYACGWEGFTEVDFIGPNNASSDPLPFRSELWTAYVRDNIACMAPVVEAMGVSVRDYLNRRAETAKNSAPSST